MPRVMRACPAVRGDATDLVEPEADQRLTLGVMAPQRAADLLHLEVFFAALAPSLNSALLRRRLFRHHFGIAT